MTYCWWDIKPEFTQTPFSLFIFPLQCTNILNLHPQNHHFSSEHFPELYIHLLYSLSVSLHSANFLIFPLATYFCFHYFSHIHMLLFYFIYCSQPSPTNSICRMDCNWLCQQDGLYLTVSEGWIVLDCDCKMDSVWLCQKDGLHMIVSVGQMVSVGWIELDYVSRMDCAWLCQ